MEALILGWEISGGSDRSYEGRLWGTPTRSHILIADILLIKYDGRIQLQKKNVCKAIMFFTHVKLQGGLLRYHKGSYIFDKN